MALVLRGLNLIQVKNGSQTCWGLLKLHLALFTNILASHAAHSTSACPTACRCLAV